MPDRASPASGRAGCRRRTSPVSRSSPATWWCGWATRRSPTGEAPTGIATGARHGHLGPPGTTVGWSEGSAMDRTHRLAISLALNAGLVVVQIGFGVIAHSTGLLADAGHNLTDVGALLLSLVAVRFALRPPSAQRSFGN